MRIGGRNRSTKSPVKKADRFLTTVSSGAYCSSDAVIGVKKFIPNPTSSHSFLSPEVLSVYAEICPTSSFPSKSLFLKKVVYCSTQPWFHLCYPNVKESIIHSVGISQPPPLFSLSYSSLKWACL